MAELPRLSPSIVRLHQLRWNDLIKKYGFTGEHLKWHECRDRRHAASKPPNDSLLPPPSSTVGFDRHNHGGSVHYVIGGRSVSFDEWKRHQMEAWAARENNPSVIDTIGIKETIGLAKARFSGIVNDYLTSWADTNGNSSEFAEWLDKIKDLVMREVGDLWTGEWPTAWFARACLTEIQTALAPLIEEWSSRASALEMKHLENPHLSLPSLVAAGGNVGFAVTLEQGRRAIERAQQVLRCEDDQPETSPSEALGQPVLTKPQRRTMADAERDLDASFAAHEQMREIIDSSALNTRTLPEEFRVLERDVHKYATAVLRILAGARWPPNSAEAFRSRLETDAADIFARACAKVNPKDLLLLDQVALKNKLDRVVSEWVGKAQRELPPPWMAGAPAAVPPPVVRAANPGEPIFENFPKAVDTTDDASGTDHQVGPSPVGESIENLCRRLEAAGFGSDVHEILPWMEEELLDCLESLSNCLNSGKDPRKCVEAYILGEFDIFAASLFIYVTDIYGYFRFRKQLGQWCTEYLPDLEKRWMPKMDETTIRIIKRALGSVEGHIIGSVDRPTLLKRLRYWQREAVKKIRSKAVAAKPADEVGGRETEQDGSEKVRVVRASESRTVQPESEARELLQGDAPAIPREAHVLDGDAGVTPKPAGAFEESATRQPVTPKPEKQLSERDAAVHKFLGEQMFCTLTNAQIMADSSLRKTLREKHRLDPGDAAKSCLDRIRKNKGYPISSEIKKKRSSEH